MRHHGHARSPAWLLAGRCLSWGSESHADAEAAGPGVHKDEPQARWRQLALETSELRQELVQEVFEIRGIPSEGPQWGQPGDKNRWS